MGVPEITDAWQHTLDMLLSTHSPASTRCSVRPTQRLRVCPQPGASADQTARAGRRQTIHLHIVEIYSNSAIAVCWRDATSGCYSEQLWKVVTARTGSTCALSGLRIRRGDAVFRPWSRGYKPANGLCMILASAVAQSVRHEDCAWLEC